MDNRGIIYLAAFIISGIPAAHGSLRNGESILNLKLERESPTGKNIRDYYVCAPATMHFADTASLSKAILAADIKRSDMPVIVQNGDGHNIYGLSAETYYKLSPVSTVWGHAGYQNGRTLGIAFCDVVDYEAVAPFVLCDETGGNIDSQRYDFGGGWGRCYNGIWSLGAQAEYAATATHRPVDPRVRNIVSDLSVVIGGARRVGQRYMLGLNAGVRVYNQETDVDFYNAVTHAITMVYTGLGGVSSRFRGGDAQSSAHRMTGFSASLQFVPATHSDSFYGAVKAERTSADLILTGYNNLNFGSTSTTMLKARMSRLWCAGRRLTLFPTISGYIGKRAATENLFGSSAENYDKIGERQNYHHNRHGVMFEMPVSARTNNGKTQLTLLPRAGYAAEKEYLIEPARSLSSDYIIGGVSLTATRKLSCHWAMEATIDYDGRFVTSTSAEWGGLNLASPQGMACQSNYDMSSSNISSQRVRLTALRALKSVVVSLTAELLHNDYKSLSESNRLAAQLSLIF